MRRLPLLAGAILLAFAPLTARADIGSFRCTFDSEPAVTLQFHVVNDTRVEITYPTGARIPYDGTGSGNVRVWRSNHNTPVRYEFDSSRRLAWARVPIDNPGALSADKPFSPRAYRVGAVVGANAPQLQALHLRSAVCEPLP